MGCYSCKNPVCVFYFLSSTLFLQCLIFLVPLLIWSSNLWVPILNLNNVNIQFILSFGQFSRCYSFQVWAVMASVLSHNPRSEWYFVGCYLGWVPWKHATRAGQGSSLAILPVLLFKLLPDISQAFLSWRLNTCVWHNGRP